MEGNEVKLFDVVSELITDNQFVKNWKILYHKLTLANIDIELLENQRKNGNLNITDLVMQILTSWISCNGLNATVQALHDVLLSNRYILLAEKLKKKFPLKASITTTLNAPAPEASSSKDQEPTKLNTDIEVPHWFEVRPQAAKFTGRVDELTKLDKFCTNNDKLILVAGMGGIGKSQLVVYFATQFYNDKNGSVIWLQGQNENSFIESIERLTGCKKPKQYSHVEICAWIFTALKAIHAKLKTNPTLIIIDNVDQRNLLVEFCIQKTKSLPPKNLPIVLVTSRKKDILGGVVSCILNLEGFDPSEAVKFVSDSLEGESDNTAADLLCKRLQYFPLALGQAVAYIQMKRQISIEVKFTISDYLGIIERQQIKLLDYKLNEIESDYTLTIFTTWNATLESIKSQGEVGIAAANILQLLAYSDRERTIMYDLPRLYEDTFVPHYENVDKHVKDAIELLRSYSMCNIQVTYGLVNVSMHCLLQEVIRLQNLMLNSTTFFKSVITKGNWDTWAKSLPNVWYDCLKSDSFVRENVEMLYDCCVEIFRWSFFYLSFQNGSEMVEECNKAIIRVLGNESQEVFVNRKCIPLLKESDTNKYTSAVLIYVDIKDVLDKDQNLAKRFAYIVDGISWRFAKLQKYNNDKHIPITECINFYKFLVLNAKKKIDWRWIALTKWVINFLCLELNTEKLHEFQYFLCNLYYKNEIEKRTLLEFLKCIEVGIQVIKGDNRCYEKFTSDCKEAVEGICSYSKQIKHQYVEKKRLFFQEDADFLYNLFLHYTYPNKHTFSFLQNLDQVFMDKYSKEDYDPKKMERSVHILSENLRSNKVCHIDACFVAHIMLAIDNLEGNRLHPAATSILLEINNKSCILFDKFLSVFKYYKHVFCEIEVGSKIDYIRRLPIFQHSTEHSVLIDAPRTLLGNNKDSKGLMLNSVNFDKDFNIENTDSSTKQNIDYYSYFGDASMDISDYIIDFNDVLTVENGLFVWKRKQRVESNRKTVFDKMKKAVLQDFELAVIAALKTVKQSTDSDFRYETLWCAARLVYFKIKAICNDEEESDEEECEALNKVLDFLDECLSLTETDTERCIFQSTINWCIFSYLETGYLKIRAFLILLRHSELNIVLLNKILKYSKSEEMSKLQLEVFKLIEKNLIRIPQNGYQVIKLIILKLIKQGNFRFSLSEFRMAASSNLNDKNLAQVIQNENEKLLFIQTINKKLSLSNWNESEIPVDLSIALFYHMILDCKSIEGETLTLLENILIFLEINDKFSEMVNVGRNAKRIYAFAKLNNQRVLHLVICKITHFLAKGKKKYMIMRLQKPIRSKNETEDIVA